MIGADSITELWRCGDALAAAGEFAQAEAMAEKLERQNPENTIEQRVHVPLDSFNHRAPAGKSGESRGFTGPGRALQLHTGYTSINEGSPIWPPQSPTRPPPSSRSSSHIAGRIGGWSMRRLPSLAWRALTRCKANATKARKPTTSSSPLGKMRTRRSRYSVKPKLNTRNSAPYLLPPQQRLIGDGRWLPVTSGCSQLRAVNFTPRTNHVQRRRVS